MEGARWLVIRRVEPISEMRVITGDAREPVETPVIRFSGTIAVVGLHQADKIFFKSGPQSCADPVFLNVVLEGLASASKKGMGRYPGRMS